MLHFRSNRFSIFLCERQRYLHALCVCLISVRPSLSRSLFPSVCSPPPPSTPHTRTHAQALLTERERERETEEESENSETEESENSEMEESENSETEESENSDAHLIDDIERQGLRFKQVDVSFQLPEDILHICIHGVHISCHLSYIHFM